jgi:hypothetical protein
VTPAAVLAFCAALLLGSRASEPEHAKRHRACSAAALDLHEVTCVITVPPTRHARIETQLGRALASEIHKVVRAGRDLSRVQWHIVDSEAPTPVRLAIVAADAGNVQLRLSPLRITFVRVASSASTEPLGEVVFPADLEAKELTALLRNEVPELMAPIAASGLDPVHLFALADDRRDRSAAIREILEWGALLAALGTHGPEPVLVIRDGLLRSIAFDGPSFALLRDAALTAIHATGNGLAAVAKSMPGGGDLVNALMLGGVLHRRPDAELAWFAIPQELELDLLPASFAVGRRMGSLIVARHRRSGSLVPIEVASEDPRDVGNTVTALLGRNAQWWPQPGMQVEVAVAHERAHVSVLDQEWMRRAFLDHLSGLNSRLARRAVMAELFGAGGLSSAMEGD